MGDLPDSISTFFLPLDLHRCRPQATLILVIAIII